MRAVLLAVAVLALPAAAEANAGHGHSGWPLLTKARARHALRRADRGIRLEHCWRVSRRAVQCRFSENATAAGFTTEDPAAIWKSTVIVGLRHGRVRLWWAF